LPVKKILYAVKEGNGFPHFVDNLKKEKSSKKERKPFDYKGDFHTGS